ncbi:MAG TPA: hypothetical protein VKD91_15495, partial [Pyrinomonadaceae bacterium]|nr:hypothetical protein [Pyrinomonadaceae bacterium]
MRRLRLTATGDDRLWPARILLQEALRTATLPGLSGNRLTLIREFKIGRFSARQSSTSLSALIDQQVGELAARAVPADHPNAAASVVVYFRDEVEPYLMLAVRIAGNADASAWFWPLAVSSWHPTMSRSQGLRALLLQLAQTRAGPVSVIALVGELFRQDLLEPLLAGLEQSDATHLLQLTCGAAIPDRSRAPKMRDEIVTEISSRGGRALRKAVQRWGGADERAIWLAAMLLAEDKPARLQDPWLVERAGGLLDLISPRPAAPAVETPGGGPFLVSEHDSAADVTGSTQLDSAVRRQAESVGATWSDDASSSRQSFTTETAQLQTSVPAPARADSRGASRPQKTFGASANANLKNKRPLQNATGTLSAPVPDSLLPPFPDSTSSPANEVRFDADGPETAIRLRDHQAAHSAGRDRLNH